MYRHAYRTRRFRYHSRIFMPEGFMPANFRLPMRAAMLAFLCVLAAGCVDADLRSDKQTPTTPEAEQWLRNGEYDRAAQAFLQIADANRDARDRYRLRAAEAYREEGNLDASAQALEGVQMRRLARDEQTRVDLLQAEIALAKHDSARASTLLTIADSDLPRPLRVRTLELRARTQVAAGDALASARTRAILDPLLDGKDRAQNENQIVGTLGQLDPNSLKQQSASMLPNDPLRPFIDQVLARNGLASPVANPNQPVGTLGEPNAPNGEGYRPAHVIALLLPVGGQLRGVALAIRDGFFAAMFSDTHMPRPEVRIYDSGSNDTDAVASYQRAVSEGADHVVGPLRRDAVSAVFAQKALPAPVLALNQPEHGEPAPAGSVAFALTPDAEAAQVAQHMIDRGITHASVIVATSDWAERAAAAFRTQFEGQHGVIVGEARLHDGEINSAASIRQAIGALPNSEDSGVFISMLPQQARLLLPQLRLVNQASRVFATSHIFSGVVNAGLDHDLDGLEFCDAPWLFDATAGLPRHSDIAASLDSARGTGARLFAMGLDAYSLVPYLEWLGTHHDSYLPGATGQLTTDAGGRVQRILVWARFQDGVAQPLNGGLQMNSVPAQ